MVGLLDVVSTFGRIGVIGSIGIMEMIGLDGIIGSCHIDRARHGQHILVYGFSGSAYEMKS